jgi:hypothetical protein
MAAKIAAAVLVILVLASVGTVGVAFYNDPTFFDQPSNSPCMYQTPSSCTVPSCCSDADDCCEQAKPECAKAEQEASPSGKQ